MDRAMSRPSRRTRHPGDYLAEELATILSDHVWIEFNPLFAQLSAGLQRRGIVQEEESLRLSTYDKLRTLVRTGAVEKSGKKYRGNHAALMDSLQRLAAEHCRQFLAAVRCAERGGSRRALRARD
jgi:hypothetical protein